MILLILILEVLSKITGLNLRLFFTIILNDRSHIVVYIPFRAYKFFRINVTDKCHVQGAMSVRHKNIYLVTPTTEV